MANYHFGSSNGKQTSLHIYAKNVSLADSVQLAGIQIDKNLKLDNHMTNLWTKAISKFDGLGRLHVKTMIMVILNSFRNGFINYSPLYCSRYSKRKTKLLIRNF